MTPVPEFIGSVQASDGVALVSLSGEIDLHSGPLLDAVLQEALGSGAPSVVLDMGEVSFCDAGGLGRLVANAKKLRNAGRELSIRGAPEPLRKLLHLTALTQILHVEPAMDAGELLGADLAAAAALPLSRLVVDAALKLVVVMAQSVMDGADGVSITLPRQGRLRTVAASNDVVLQMDQDQYDTGQGPCLDAATHGTRMSSPALVNERRWPEFVPRARARGIESIMSTPLLAAAAPLGALNVYSRSADALAAHEHEWAVQFADEAAGLLITADVTATAASLDSAISRGLHSREVIALAQGIVMARERLSPDAAHRFLIDISRRTSRPLLGICESLVSSTSGHRSRRGAPPWGAHDAIT